MDKSPRACMERALAQAQQQAARSGDGSGDHRPNPLVGCVVVTSEGDVIEGYRGELNEGEHAEFTILERKLSGSALGATVYTTLEPCTHRTGVKISCADRLVEAGVKRVVIGYRDPDERGQGIEKLYDAGIEVDFFHEDLSLKIRELNKNFIESRRQSSLSRHWFPEVEAACDGKIRILADLAEEPRMNRLGDFPFPPELAETYRENLSNNLRDSGGWNEKIAAFKGIRRGGTVMDYEEYDFIQWSTLRDVGLRPISVYAGAIVFCPDTASIYVHRRSPKVKTEPNKFHSFSGAFQVSFNNNSDERLLYTGSRELLEETGVHISLEKPRVSIVENLEIGWVDVMFHAGTISEHDVKFLRASKEGDIVAIAFDDIADHMIGNRDSWVVSGVAHHLIWLKLGAPGAPSWIRDKAEGIYQHIVQALM